MTIKCLESLRSADGSCDEYYNACLQIETTRQTEDTQQNEAEPNDAAVPAKKRKKSFLGRLFGWIVSLAILCIAAHFVGNTSWGFPIVDTLYKIPGYDKVDQLIGDGVEYIAGTPWGKALIALDEREEFDPFDWIEVQYSGVAPFGTAKIVSYYPYSGLQEEYEFSTPVFSLSNGDEVTVRLTSYNKSYLRKSGYKLKTRSKTYTVSGLVEAVTEPNDIAAVLTGDVIQQVISKTRDEYYDLGEKIRGNDFDALFSVSDREKILWGAYGTLGEFSIVGQYFLLATSPGETNFNKCTLIFEVPVVLRQSHGDEDRSLYEGHAYFAVDITNLTFDAHGQIHIDYESMDFQNPFLTYADAVSSLTKNNREHYKITEIDVPEN